jgi:hypothetical protein
LDFEEVVADLVGEKMQAQNEDGRRNRIDFGVES